jgi:hypothetical protein
MGIELVVRPPAARRPQGVKVWRVVRSAARGTRHANTQTASQGICTLLECPTTYVAHKAEFQIFPNQLDKHRNSLQAEKLGEFIKRYWEINKKIPTGRQMCDALNFETRQAVYTLLLKMREGSPLVARSKRYHLAVIGDAEAWRDAWKRRNYLRYRSLKLERDHRACYKMRSLKPLFFSSLSRKVLSCPQ